MNIGDVQRGAWQNKIEKGFNTKDVGLEFGLLYGEVAEAFDAWRKGEPVGPELADVAIYLAGLAEMTGHDLASEVEAKMAVNQARAYVEAPNGTLVKAEAGLEAPELEAE
jgi:NTP pyrophosphatase (non-canonical NTP hydrolase)